MSIIDKITPGQKVIVGFLEDGSYREEIVKENDGQKVTITTTVSSEPTDVDFVETDYPKYNYYLIEDNSEFPMRMFLNEASFKAALTNQENFNVLYNKMKKLKSSHDLDRIDASKHNISKMLNYFIDEKF